MILERIERGASMPTLEIDSLVKKMTKSQKRAMLEALMRELFPSKPLTKAERKVADAELDRRIATRKQSVSAEQLIHLSKVAASNVRRKPKSGLARVALG
jgi:hypothetical protein